MLMSADQVASKEKVTKLFDHVDSVIEKQEWRGESRGLDLFPQLEKIENNISEYSVEEHEGLINPSKDEIYILLHKYVVQWGRWR